MKVTSSPQPHQQWVLSQFLISCLSSAYVYPVTSTGRWGKGMGMASFFLSRELQTLPLQMEKYGDDASIMQADPQQMSPWFYWRGLGEGSAKAALN